MEQRTSTPAARLRAIAALRAAGVPVRVMIAPVIPGLTDLEIPAILKAAQEAGATAAGYVMLRLPLTGAPVFSEWLERTQATRRDKVLAWIRGVREGQLNANAFGTRMRGSGEIADQIGAMFRAFARNYGLDRELPPLDAAQFTPPQSASGQLRLWLRPPVRRVRAGGRGARIVAAAAIGLRIGSNAFRCE